MNNLLESGILGNYTQCAVIEIFGIEKSKIFNIYTICTFEESKSVQEEKSYLTERLCPFFNREDIKWGIIKRTLSIDAMKKCLNEIEESHCLMWNDKEGISLENLELIERQYICGEEGRISPLNRILKNNFTQGSYIVEFFDTQKEHLQFMFEEPTILNDFSEKVSEILPISLAGASDRLGNVIIQFPIRSIQIEEEYLQDKAGIKLFFRCMMQTNQARTLLCMVNDRDEEAIYDSKMVFVEIAADTETLSKEIEIQDSHEIEIVVYDMTNQLYLYHKTMNQMKDVIFNMNIASNQNRVFHKNGKLVEVSVSSEETFHLHSNRGKDCEDWTNERKYERERKVLEANHSFVQYVQNSHDKAVADVRALLKLYGQKGVYLWDPYLSAEDIKEILYYTPYVCVPMRAITELNTTEADNKTDQLQNIRKQLDLDDRKYLLLNLEVRAKIKQYGWKFHDRFIIFPLEKPRVWSLGASVNQLGEKHHILQEVKNAQHILNAFEELWAQLNHEECIVWKI